MKNIKSFEQFIAENKQTENSTTVTEGEKNNDTVNEGASISSISSKLEKVAKEMKSTVVNWKKEKDESKKEKLKEKLIELTAKKKELEKELFSAVEEIDKDAELKDEE